MLNEMIRGVSKFLTTDRIIIVVILLVLGYGLWAYAGSKVTAYDGMADGTAKSQPAAASPAPSLAPVQSAGAGYAPHPTVSPSELLPNDANSQWAALNPVNQGNINAPDLLTAGYHIGLDTIGQTLKNASWDLRSDPIIPKQEVGPWNQSTYEPDYARVPLEIGAGSR
jgi:hypothetical protein